MNRISQRIFLLIVLGTLTAVSTMITSHPGGNHPHEGSWSIPSARAQASAYLQTFDGRPPEPAPFRPMDWDVQISHNDSASWKQFPPTPAQHGPDCSAPPATHVVTSHEQAVFTCNDHMMTTIAAGYGVIILTPNQLVDFSTGEAVVRFDLSTLRTTTRDWVDIWISPYEDHLALPLDDGQDLNGPPRRGVLVKMGWNGRTIFFGGLSRNFEITGLELAEHTGVESVLPPSAADREPFELRISRTHLRFGMPNRNLWWLDTSFADLGWSRGVVQFGHHTYDILGDCRRWDAATQQYVDGVDPCPNTWHWDNVRIEPAVPFTMLRADRRYVDKTTAPSVSFPQPAPEGAHLRFGGVGAALDVSFDGGATWQPAQSQIEIRPRGYGYSSFWTPVPAGTTEVQFRGQDGVFPWMARDISIFALSHENAQHVEQCAEAGGCDGES